LSGGSLRRQHLRLREQRNLVGGLLFGSGLRVLF
jgi:hypothetical protein